MFIVIVVSAFGARTYSAALTNIATTRNSLRFALGPVMGFVERVYPLLRPALYFSAMGLLRFFSKINSQSLICPCVPLIIAVTSFTFGMRL